MARPNVINEQSEGDSFVKTGNFNSLVGAGNKSLRGVSFDEQQFVSENNPNQQTVSLQTEDDLFNFSIRKDSATSVRVYGGRWVRNAGGIDTIILLSTDGGTSGNIEDFKTVTGLTANSSTYFIILTLDAVFVPTQLTASASTTYPTDDDDNLKKVIGEVQTNSNGKIDRVLNYDHDIDGFYMVPDADSPAATDIRRTLEYNPEATDQKGVVQLYDVDTVVAGERSFNYFDEAAANLKWSPLDSTKAIPTNKSLDINATTGIEIYGFNAAASEAIVNSDLFVLKQNASSEVHYGDISSVADALIAGGGPWDPPPWEAPGAVQHTDLDFLATVAGIADQNKDHDLRYWVKGDDYTECFGSSIGSDALTIRIDLANKELEGESWTANPTGSYNAVLGTSSVALVANSPSTSCNIASSAYSVDALADINTASDYFQNGNQGLTRTSNANILADDGTQIPIIIRGGILCLT
jgi:hypothetical protein